MKKNRIILIAALLLILTLACNVTGLTQGSKQMEATAVALQATQTALDLMTLQLQQQLTAAAQAPTPEVSAQGAQPSGAQVNFEGVQFTYEPSLAAGVTTRIVPAEEDLGGIIPEHLEIVFDNYAWEGSMHTPTIYVFSVDSYRSANEYVNPIIDELMTTLEQKQPQSEHLPFLPMWNAGQMFYANLEYVDFQNGSGIRFLSQYGQAIYPINNNGLFYTFQGLTNDGAWYVAAVLPVANPGLSPDGNDPPGGDWEAFDQNFEAHLSQVTTFLQAQPPRSFTPDLDLLDELVRSLQVK